jgi:hypothetical protein
MMCGRFIHGYQVRLYGHFCNVIFLCLAGAEAPTIGKTKRRGLNDRESLLQAPVVPENFGRPSETTVRV